MVSDDKGAMDTTQPTAPRKPRLSFLTPQQRELLAQWIESKVRNIPERIGRERAYLKERPDDKQSARQLMYYENLISAARWFASLVRQEGTRQRSAE